MWSEFNRSCRLKMHTRARHARMQLLRGAVVRLAGIQGHVVCATVCKRSTAERLLRIRTTAAPPKHKCPTNLRRRLSAMPGHDDKSQDLMDTCLDEDSIWCRS